MKNPYQEELFAKLIEHPSWKEESRILSTIIGAAIWLIVPLGIEDPIKAQLKEFDTPDQEKEFRPIITSLLNEVKKKENIQKFSLTDQRHFYCLPIKRKEELYGYVLVCDLENTLSETFIKLINSYTCTTIESIQKELEVAKLYETIRPKTIALSTVHTVSRIISSTLELDELLPRIARLSLQVLRARRCCIMLVDKYNRNLIPHAVVDVQNKNVKQKILKIGEGVPGKVVKNGNAIVSAKVLCVPLVAEEHIIGAITMTQRLNNKPFGIFDKEILTTLSEQAVIAIKNAQLYDEQEKLTLNSIKALASILSSGVADNYGRSNLFINVIMSIGMELKLGSDQMRMLYYASILHNVSQMGLPKKILRKSTKLTGKDYEIIKEQHIKGAQLITPIGGRLKAVLPIIIHHHERYDGNGYPSGLRGDDIPLGARVLAVADSFEAMLSTRPYRRKLSISQAVSEIVHSSGEQFDPVIVDAFVRVIKRSKNKIFKNKGKAWSWKKM
ncbi:MAG: HD domain-containing protein [Candidatus Omnitrophica bacterium]|nr:HD domain-containing protein [Candidatus Omnitrophota bacterium]